MRNAPNLAAWVLTNSVINQDFDMHKENEIIHSTIGTSIYVVKY